MITVILKQGKFLLLITNHFLSYLREKNKSPTTNQYLPSFDDFIWKILKFDNFIVSNKEIPAANNIRIKNIIQNDDKQIKYLYKLLTNIY